MADFPEAYSLKWLQMFRKTVYARMEEFAQKKKEPLRLRNARKELDENILRRQELVKLVVETCPHLLENQIYKEAGRTDPEYGSYLPGGHSWIWCRGCGKTLWEEWKTS